MKVEKGIYGKGVSFSIDADGATGRAVMWFSLGDEPRVSFLLDVTLQEAQRIGFAIVDAAGTAEVQAGYVEKYNAKAGDETGGF